MPTIASRIHAWNRTQLHRVCLLLLALPVMIAVLLLLLPLL